MHKGLAPTQVLLPAFLFIASDAAHARFVSVDPAPPNTTDGQNFNRYWYGDNNPYKFVDPDGRRVVFAEGSSDTFKAQFGEIIQHLNQHGTSGVFRRLEARSEIITIQEATRPHQMEFDVVTDTIRIDPLSGLKVAPGRVQTPALGVLHEAGHAEAHLSDPQGELADFETVDDNYRNVSERKVIENVETPAAKTMGEPTRTTHGGTPVHVRCPTCSE